VTPLRLFAVFLIFVLATVAWVVLGTANLVRTEEADRTMTAKVAGLYGQPQTQNAPRFEYVSSPGAPPASGPLDVDSTDATAAFELDQRQKGLMWFATYKVDFAAGYKVSNPTSQPADVAMTFAFPSPQGVYDGFAVRVDGKEVPVRYVDGAAVARFRLPASSGAHVETGYRTYGMNEWRYVPKPDGVGVMRDFSLVMTTDFAQVDFADGSVSPVAKKRTAAGWSLEWTYDSVVSGRPIALVMPKPMNSGPLAYRIAYFAPVSLLFFFAGLVLLTATRDVKLHPMHYGFLAAAFFAFHLLLSYLADQIPMGWAFGIASVVSLVLVVGYLGAVIGRSRVLVEVAASQLLFLVLFSYSFFFEGLTGLAVTIGSVLTLGYFMGKTARLDWEKVFERARKAAPVFAAEARTE
jgi:hypothetical protein